MRNFPDHLAFNFTPETDPISLLILLLLLLLLFSFFCSSCLGTALFKKV